MGGGPGLNVDFVRFNSNVPSQKSAAPAAEASASIKMKKVNCLCMVTFVEIEVTGILRQVYCLPT